ncbi:MAG TPA: 3'-5' exonuclease, partial [Hyphomicrobiaceae bacterium]|nr:3'-5' exonuclease [Hyphomicrobiaceae bacterium]
MSRSTHSTPLVALDVVVLDTETTGLDAAAARIVQVGAVRMRAGAIVAGDTFDRLVNPGVPIPKATTAIHGLADEDVQDAP